MIEQPYTNLIELIEVLVDVDNGCLVSANVASTSDAVLSIATGNVPLLLHADT